MRNNVTLIMTRQPTTEFVWLQQKGKSYYEVIDDQEEEQKLFGTFDPATKKRVGGDKSARKAISGRWGTMAVVTGPVVTGALRHMSATQGSSGSSATSKVEQITLAGQTVSLVTDGSSPVTTLAEFDTMERYRGNDNKDIGFVKLPEQPFKPYPLDIIINKKVAEFHEKMGIRAGHTGKCFLVRGHTVLRQNKLPAGILVHEAPHPGWLTGCIAPRLKNHREFSNDSQPCIKALNVIYKAMGTGRRCHLFIID